jgi:hypothetical protein
MAIALDEKRTDNEAKLTLQEFILGNLDKARCATLLLFIGVLDGNVDFVERALDKGADINHAMTGQEKRILKMVGYKLE